MLSVERLPRCALAVGIAALFLHAACEAPPAGQPTVIIGSLSPPPSPTDPPRRAPTPTPPNGPDALVCAERVAVPQIADVIGLAWSPNGRTLAIDHMVVLPSARITGSPEDFFLDALDLPTGELTPLGVGERQQWSASGKYLSYWSWDGDLRIVIGGRVIDLPRATIPDVRWGGDPLYSSGKEELQPWTEGGVKTTPTLPADVVPTYPADDASFSADAERFLITRYSLDGTVQRYAGVTRTGAGTALDLADATYTECSPTGEAPLARYPHRGQRPAGDTARAAP